MEEVNSNKPETEEEIHTKTELQMIWKQLKKHNIALWGAGILILFYFVALFAEFFAPYSQELETRTKPFHPPTKIHVRDVDGRFHLPFIYNDTEVRDPETYRHYYKDITEKRYPIKLFVKGEPYKLLWLIPMDIHLFGVDEPARVFLMGTDWVGRDVLSRIIFGSRISLTVGLLGIGISYSLGMLFGGISGFYGGLIDNVIQRTGEVIMSTPSFYLLLALAAALPANLPSTTIYLMIILILSFIGWSGLARIIRGMVLSLREREFVVAAQAIGVSNIMIIIKHILPNTFSQVIVMATLSVPHYILGEASLSFLGLGIKEPMASWGNMLSSAKEEITRFSSDPNVSSHPWLLIPGIFIFITVLAFFFLGDGLRDAIDPRLRTE